MTTPTAKPTATKEVTITRVFDAPRSRVFKMWIEPEHMAQWWGPHHFTNPVCKLDVRPGGAILVQMRAPDGTVYPMSGTFHEIDEPKRLVFLCAAEGLDGEKHLESLTTVTFEDLGGKTKVTVEAKAVGFSAAAPQMLGGMEAGWTQSLEKLSQLVARV